MFNLRLGAIDGIEGLVQEKSDGKGEVDPWRHVLVHGGIIPQHGEKIDNDEAKARQGDLGSSLKIRGVTGATEPARTHGIGPVAVSFYGDQITSKEASTHAIDMGKHLMATLV